MRLVLKLIIVDMACLSRQELILFLTFVHGNDDHKHKAEDHAENLHSIQRFIVNIIAHNRYPKGARLEENHKKRKRYHLQTYVDYQSDNIAKESSDQKCLSHTMLHDLPSCNWVSFLKK